VGRGFNSATVTASWEGLEMDFVGV
jgi:hypothetical protein